jgi:uncharacterized protein YkwD
MRHLTPILLATAALLQAAAIPATSGSPSVDVAGITNALRAGGCAGRAPLHARLRADAALDHAARLLASGQPLHQALASSGYHALDLASIRLSGAASPAQLRAALAQRFCGSLSDPDFKDLGAYATGDRLWMIIAVRFVPPSGREAARIELEVLEQINAARAQGRRCGGQRFAAAPPLAFAPQLSRIAREHSLDMAIHHEFEHEGHDGSTPAERVHRSGYRARLIGENIAFGPVTAEDVVQGWLASPGHCANLMNRRFTETGIALTADQRGRAGLYWTQLFVER